MIDKEDLIEQLHRCEIVSDKFIKKIKEIVGEEEFQELFDEYNDIYFTMGELIITLKDED